MSVNDSSVANQSQFKNKIAPSEPLTTKGHAPGTKVGNDAVPEFHAQNLPAGTAPADRTFKPNPTNETPGQAENPDKVNKERTFASDTINGASSADVHQGLGLPVQGQSSQELRGSGFAKGRKEGTGLAGVGADQGDSFRERGLDVDGPTGTRGKSGQNRENILGAEDREPVGAEAVAAERN